MPAPVYSAGSPGNLVSSAAVGASQTVGAFLDLSAAIEGQLDCQIVTGGSAPAAATVFSAYRAYAAGPSAPISLTASVTAGTASTTLSTSSKAGLSVGQNVALQKAGTAPQSGEVVTVTSISGSSSPFTIGVTGGGANSGTVYSYSSGDGVYLIGQTAAFAVAPSNASGGWAASKTYSSPMFLGSGQWFVAANNTAAVGVTASVTVDKVTSFS